MDADTLMTLCADVPESGSGGGVNGSSVGGGVGGVGFQPPTFGVAHGSAHAHGPLSAGPGAHSTTGGGGAGESPLGAALPPHAPLPMSAHGAGSGGGGGAGTPSPLAAAAQNNMNVKSDPVEAHSH